MFRFLAGAVFIYTALFGGDTISLIKTEKKIRIGIKYDTPPFGYLENKKIRGFDFELSKLVIQKLKERLKVDDLKVFYKKVYPDNREKMLIDKRVDMVIATYSPIEKRKKSVSFSIPYFKTKIAVLSKDKSIPHTIGVLKGSSAVEYLKNYDLKLYEGYEKLFKAFENGEVKAVATDSSILDYYTKQHKNSYNLKVLDYDSFYAIGVRKGDEKFLKILNEIVEELNKKGKLNLT